MYISTSKKAPRKYFEQKFGVIYKISIIFKDKEYIYIGQTRRNINIRFNEHKNNNPSIRYLINHEDCIEYSCKEISKIIYKNNLNNNELQLLLNSKESFYIKHYNSYDSSHGLNRKKGPSNRKNISEFLLAVKKYKGCTTSKETNTTESYKSKKPPKNYIPRINHCKFKKIPRKIFNTENDN